MSDDLDMKIEKTPIIINEHAIALLTVFSLRHDNLEDLWAHEYLCRIREPDHAAEQLIERLCDGGRVAPVFLMAIQRAVKKKLAQMDADNKDRGVTTTYAERE